MGRCYFQLWSKALIPHLFRTGFSKITAVLCEVFGLEHIEIAEDITSETLVAALEAIIN